MRIKVLPSNRKWNIVFVCIQINWILGMNKGSMLRHAAPPVEKSNVARRAALRHRFL